MPALRRRREEQAGCLRYAMKIEGAHTVKAPQDIVWNLLVDPIVLARCMPGCEGLETTGEHAYKTRLKVGVAAIKGSYEATIRLEEVHPPASFKMKVEGKGATGFVRGAGTMSLSAADGGTRVHYSGEVQIGGAIAAVGQRMLQAASNMMVGQFFTAIEAEAIAVVKAESTGAPVEPPKHGILRNLGRSILKSAGE